MPAVIHVKHDHEGGIRILTDEPVGASNAHSVVRVTVPGQVRDHDATFNALFIEDGNVAERCAYKKGDAAESVEVHLAGQREFAVPAGATSIQFADGSVYELAGAK